MTQLANANLLDDSVANSSSLKNQRINKTAQRAVNPKPIQDEVDDIEEEDDDDNNLSTVKRDFPTSNFERKSFSKSSKIDDKVEDNKILGMKPILFYGILATVAIVGGYFAYKKFFNKGKGVLDLPKAPTNPSPTTTNVISGQ